MAATRDGAYKFELFEANQAAMPAPKRQEEPKGPQRVVREKRQTKAETEAEARAINKRLAKIFIVAVCFVALLIVNMSAHANMEKNALAIAAVQTAIEQENSRTVDLRSKLTQKMSTEAIEDYAINRLGMIKINRSQINYINANSGDSVVYSDGAGQNSGE